MPAAARGAPKRVPQLEKYEQLRELGRGSHGTVWLVRRKTDRKLLAMKSVLLPPLACNEDKAIAQRKQALREVDILRMVDSPYLVGYTEAILAPAGTNRPQSELHIVTEYCDGGDLSVHLRKVGAGLPETSVWSFAVAILHGLRELHQRSILHRDLKPANIFLKRAAVGTDACQRPRSARSVSRGRCETVAAGALDFGVVVGDLGVAREMSNSQPLASTMVGTPLYCAPEVFEGQAYGEKADVYSFGVCIYELMHGRPPFAQVQNMGALVRLVLNLDGTPDESRLPMDPQYSHKLRTFVAQCLSLSPEQRPTVEELFRIMDALQVPRQVENLVACSEPAADTPAPSTTHKLVRHSSQPRIASARSPSLKPTLVRSPSLPPAPSKHSPQSAAPLRALSPKQAAPSKARSPRQAVPSKALSPLQAPPSKSHSPRSSPRPSLVSVAGRARTPSPGGRFNFQPPCRRASSQPACRSAVRNECAETNASGEAATQDQTQQLLLDLAEAQRVVGTDADGVLSAECVQIDPASNPTELSPLVRPPLESSSLVTAEDASPSASPQNVAKLLPSPRFGYITGAADLTHGQVHAASFVAASAGAQVAKRDLVNVEVQGSMSPSSASVDVTPTGICLEVDSFSEGGAQENEMGDARSAESPASGKPCLVPRLAAFCPPPRGGPLVSAKALQSPPNSVRSRPSSAAAVRCSVGGLQDTSMQCDVDRAGGVRQRGKAYVAKAQECWSRWRRDRVEAKVGGRPVGLAAKTPLVGPQCAPTELTDVTNLEVRGVAPPRTPVSKKVGRSSLAAARALYTPPSRRAKGARA